MAVAVSQVINETGLGRWAETEGGEERGNGKEGETGVL